MAIIVVLSISVVLQLIAVGMVLRLIRTVGGRLVWLTLSLAILLMSIRRMISLGRAIRDYPEPVSALDTELVALTISALILVAVFLIRPLMDRIKFSYQKLNEETLRNELILQTCPDGFVITDDTGKIYKLNPAFCLIAGSTEQDIKQKNIYDLFDWSASELGDKPLERLQGFGEKRFETTITSNSQAEIEIEITAKFVEFANEHFIYIFARDISINKQARIALAEEKNRAQVTLESIGDGVITTDISGEIQYMNPVAEIMTGHLLRNVKGQALTSIMRLFDEVQQDEINDPVAECLEKNKGYLLSDKPLLMMKGNDSLSVEIIISPLHNENKTIIGSVMVIHNVTELKSLTESLSYQATHDELTGLVNRREFENRLETALMSAKQNNLEHAMCYIDMDQFKLVNDTCGHIAGDQLLRQLTQLLHGVVRESDTLARLGGDEFGVLLESCNLKQARRLVDSIFSAVKEYRFQWENRVFEVGLSIGLVPVTKDSGNLTDVLSAADSACYVAKENGRNCMHMFIPNDQALLERRGQMEWVQRIQQAIKTDRFRLYGQIIQSINKTPALTHIEILLRMVDEDGAIITPNEFMPIAERYHMMPNIDRWVVNEVLRCMSELKNCQIENTDMVTINLSGQSIGDEEFLSYVLDLFEEYTVPGNRICFEVTETAVISNITHARNFISVLRHHGCRFALDDFGSGLSSFQYLKDLDVDYLKIDGSFISSMRYNENNYNMVISINNIGRIMGLQTIAEFVESEEVKEMLQDIGVDFVQGYNVGKPYPLFGKKSVAA